MSHARHWCSDAGLTVDSRERPRRAERAERIVDEEGLTGMCGIAGALASPGGLDALRVATAGVAAHKLRGPDNEAVIDLEAPYGARISLGHNRLSVIDLSPEANQPFWDYQQRRCALLNGEIYNYIELRTELRERGHRFRTSSDTEVLLAAFQEWDADAVHHLNGMFAFAIAIPREGRLFIARDRFGVKPLYYRADRESLMFSSTPGPIAQVARLNRDEAYAARGLRYWIYDADDRLSGYEGVQSLPGGFVLDARADPDGCVAVTPRRYYDFGDRVAGLAEDIGNHSEERLLRDLESHMTEAVDLRLRADVPVAVALSGGLDSTTIAALAAARRPSLKAFCFGDPTDPRSEGPAVARVASELDIDVEFVWPETATMAAAFDQALSAQDAPFRSLSIVAQFLVFRAARLSGVKVVLGGQGADEILMGYRKYQLFHLVAALKGAAGRTRIGALIDVAKVIAAEATNARAYIPQLARYRARGMRTNLRLPSVERWDLGGSAHLLRDRQVLDVTRFSLPTLLRYEDRNSMGNSIESRLPYLDYRLAEFSVALPARMKLRDGYGKWALRQVARRRSPTAVWSERRKIGFAVDPGRWIRGGIGSFIRERLHERRDRVIGLIRPDEHISKRFSDERLIRTAGAMPEAVTLLWLTNE